MLFAWQTPKLADEFMSPDVSGKFASGCAEFDKVANSKRTLGWDVVVGGDGEVIFQ